MQDAFEEFARQVGAGNTAATAIVERTMRENVKKELALVGLERKFDEPKSKKSKYSVNELSNDTLYDMISENDESKERDR